MKFLFFYLLTSFIILKPGAQTIADVARSPEIIWYGVDFTKAKFSGFDDSNFVAKMPELIDKLSFSPLTKKQQDFFEFRLDKQEIINKTEVVQKRNSSIDPKNLLTNSVYNIDRDSIQQIVDEYKFSGKGYGLLLIAEFFDEREKFIQVWAAFLDNATGKVLYKHRYSTKLDMRITTIRNKWYDAMETIMVSVCKDLKHSK